MSEFLVNPAGRVVDVDSGAAGELKRKGFRAATREEIEKAYPAQAGVAGVPSGIGIDNLSNVRSPNAGMALVSNAPASVTDAAVARYAETARAEALGIAVGGVGVQIGNTDAVLRAMSTDKESTLAEDDLNAAARRAPETITEAYKQGSPAAPQQSLSAAEEDAAQRRAIQEAAERARAAAGLNPTKDAQAADDDSKGDDDKKAEDEQEEEDDAPKVLTGKDALPEDFPGLKQLTAAGLTTLGQVADHDYEANPIRGIGVETRKAITDYLGKPNIELDA